MVIASTVARSLEGVARADAAVDVLFSPHREKPIVRGVALFSKLGDQPQLRLLSGLCIAAGLLGSRPRLARAGVRMLLAHEIATLAKNLVKDEVDRKRPRSANSLEERKPKPGRSSEKEDTSFPSGHTAGSLAVASAFSREFPEYRTPALLAAGAVAAALVPRCAHYVSDVGAGAMVGLLSEAASNTLWTAEIGDVRKAE